MNKLASRVLVMVVIYAILKFVGGSAGRMALYPITLLVAFLHELGHALGALLTGGQVESLSINPDGSGVTTTRGGIVGAVIAGGYLGSVLLGNFLFWIGAKRNSWCQPTIIALAGLMVFSAIVWHNSLISSALQIGFAAILFFIAHKTDWDKDVLMFLGLATVLYVIEDFNVGPSSDLEQFEQRVGIFSKKVWMWIWLLVAVVFSFRTIARMFNFSIPVKTPTKKP